MIRSLGFKLIFLCCKKKLFRTEFHVWTFSIFSDFVISQKGELWFTICEFVKLWIFIHLLCLHSFFKCSNIFVKFKIFFLRFIMQLVHFERNKNANAKNLRRNWIFCFCFFLGIRNWLEKFEVSIDLNKQWKDFRNVLFVWWILVN